jgi:hypothetical protein
VVDVPLPVRTAPERRVRNVCIAAQRPIRHTPPTHRADGPDARATQRSFAPPPEPASNFGKFEPGSVLQEVHLLTRCARRGEGMALAAAGGVAKPVQSNGTGPGASAESSVRLSRLAVRLAAGDPRVGKEPGFQDRFPIVLHGRLTPAEAQFCFDPRPFPRYVLQTRDATVMRDERRILYLSNPLVPRAANVSFSRSEPILPEHRASDHPALRSPPPPCPTPSTR